MSIIKDNAVETMPNFTYCRELTKEEIDEQKTGILLIEV